MTAQIFVHNDNFPATRWRRIDQLRAAPATVK